MTHHVAHTNKILFDLKIHHQNRISQLQDEITSQQKEILQLREEIKLLTQEKFYDC
jgi:hypothetical protein